MFYKIKSDRVELEIKVKPNAKETQILGIENNQLKVALHALAKEGEANSELIRFLAKQCKLPQKELSLIRGTKSRLKCIQLPLTAQVQLFLDDINMKSNI